MTLPVSYVAPTSLSLSLQTAGMKLIENYHNMEERFAVFSGQTEDMLVFKVAIVNVVCFWWLSKSANCSPTETMASV